MSNKEHSSSYYDDLGSISADMVRAFYDNAVWKVFFNDLTERIGIVHRQLETCPKESVVLSVDGGDTIKVPGVEVLQGELQGLRFLQQNLNSISDDVKARDIELSEETSSDEIDNINEEI